MNIALEKSRVNIENTTLNVRPLASIDDALKRIFTITQEETFLLKCRQIMGSSVKNISDEELESYITEFQHILDSWLDCFERELFDGRTLQQVIGQG